MKHLLALSLTAPLCLGGEGLGVRPNKIEII